ncbi:MAG TPA: DUF2947 family protein [Tepidisphaeraceae bacterium]|jgi:hypothetical protein|nr:DUF2947 family protein [Tepidisphaeraceae bacterium]
MDKYRPITPALEDWLSVMNTRIPAEALGLIRPLTEEFCLQIWDRYVGYRQDHPAWLLRDTWIAEILESESARHWSSDYNASRPEPMRAIFRQKMPWPDDAAVYMLWSACDGLEIRWDIFLRHWINFLRDDEFPLLISPDHAEAAVFSPHGGVYFGHRPKGVAGGWPIVAFDLDETLGVPITDGQSVTGFRMRPWCGDLLLSLRGKYKLALWTVSSRQYLGKILNHGLPDFFENTYTWDESPSRWKDIRALGIDWLVDDSDYHRELAVPHGMAGRYIIVPAYGSAEDERDPSAWAGQVRDILLPTNSG